MAERELQHGAAARADRAALEGTAPRRRRTVRPAGAPEKISGAADAGEESAAVCRGVEGDRRHPQTRQGARGLDAEDDDGHRGAAETARRPRRRQRRSEIALGYGARGVAALARRSAHRGRAVEGEGSRDRSDASRTPAPRIPSHFQAAPERRRRARDRRFVQRLPHARPPRRHAAAQARRSRSLRRLQPHPLPGDAHILKITAHVDGACRGNPGPASYGVYMRKEDGEILEISGFLGTTTNNVAEYAGLLEALATAKAEGATEVEIVSDSLLLVQQMLGKYRVKHPNLVPLYERAKVMSRAFRRFSIRHTLRAGNKDADRLANKAVDRAEGRSLERRRA